MVHVRDYEVVGTSELLNCSTAEEGCALRCTHESLRTSYASKLAMAYKRDLGVNNDWNGTLSTSSPVRSDLVTQYVGFVREK